jgi:hypothetical protein
MFDSIERARIVADMPRAHYARGTTDKLQKPTIKHRDTTVTKAQTRQVQQIDLYLVDGNVGAAARSISALIRSALRDRDIAELRAYAIARSLTSHRDYIV